jgi:hypothetical protein
MRLVLQSLSQSLDSVLRVAFLPASIRDFESASAPNDLGAIAAAFAARGEPDPPRGIVAAFTERPMPRRPGRHPLGQAEFLGRLLFARLEPDAISSRTLAHEILHLYGAVHLSERVDSLMNPRGAEWVVRTPNASIAGALRQRRFGPGGLEANVFPYIDLDETIDAYLAAIRANLTLRRLGIEEVLRETRSRRARVLRMRREAKLDSHLGDVCEFTAQLLWRAERRVDAVVLYETAAQLYGPRSERGRAVQAQADALRKGLREHYGLD